MPSRTHIRSCTATSKTHVAPRLLDSAPASSFRHHASSFRRRWAIRYNSRVYLFARPSVYVAGRSTNKERSVLLCLRSRIADLRLRRSTDSLSVAAFIFLCLLLFLCSTLSFSDSTRSSVCLSIALISGARVGLWIVGLDNVHRSGWTLKGSLGAERRGRLRWGRLIDHTYRMFSTGGCAVCQVVVWARVGACARCLYGVEKTLFSSPHLSRCDRRMAIVLVASKGGGLSSSTRRDASALILTRCCVALRLVHCEFVASRMLVHCVSTRPSHDVALPSRTLALAVASATSSHSHSFSNSYPALAFSEPRSPGPTIQPTPRVAKVTMIMTRPHKFLCRSVRYPIPFALISL